MAVRNLDVRLEYADPTVEMPKTVIDLVDDEGNRAAYGYLLAVVAEDTGDIIGYQIADGRKFAATAGAIEATVDLLREKFFGGA